MDPEKFERQMNTAPQAYAVKTFKCANPECERHHVVLLDEEDNVIAHFVPPDGFGLRMAHLQGDL